MLTVELAPVVVLYVDDFEGSNVGISDVQTVHEVVATQRSEEPVSRTRLKFCALRKMSPCECAHFDLVTHGVPMLTTPE
jgi:hypothetical protein